ncbi:MAG: class I SAM-dependent methyltransferase [Rickettsiales bacterium]|nr:class I SAM-dependent methyltransferase [Pseudomonadota bacterium]MDA0965870.1 class I SAM-dependent methyltransferase [Pseudomonadota bacterium]MDG4542660.1 class I SAM-dependent methyltransferase [Rickettsiales bacterium]MDG4545164.1 class I SAM-dependent methyltransferase [Rickettsiales bacterium]MDG4547287.1 class I SAM-dependent methyltransferase [Rickettsiales bacterium]
MQNSLFQENNYIEEVRNQYESYPYPPRDPNNEYESFTYVPSASLDFLNYYHYEGKQDFSENYSVLVAGGGTGDALVTMAEQCRKRNVKIVYLDISNASMEVAKARLKVRGLDDNVEWVHGSLLDCAKLFDEKFDYINCSGVLHHLESPEKGLEALSSVLKDNGVMALMVYAKYGREGVYQIQNLMKILNKNEKNMQQKVENCKAVLSNLPKTSGFMDVHHLFSDIREFGDTGIYDLLLHSNDVAYCVPKLYELCKKSSLDITHFCYSDKNIMGNNLYNIEAYIGNRHLRDNFEKLSVAEKQAAAELINGKIIKHSFLASKIKSKTPSTSDHNNIPFLSVLMNDGSYKAIYEVVKNCSLNEVVTCKVHNMEVRFRNTKNAGLLFKYIDGKRTIGEIFKAVRGEYPKNEKKPSLDELQEEFDKIFKAFVLYDWMYLRNKNIPPVMNVQNIQKRLVKSKS